MHIRLPDILFFLLAGAFCLSAFCGVQELSPGGICMDSDLQNYTQILAQQLDPSAFAADPVAPDFAFFPGVPNLLTILAGWLALGDGAVAGIFRAGALTIWIHLAGFYLLGHWLFKSRGLAVMLTVLMSITVYWGFGTFWGATHADPVPRVLYAGLCFPLWLWLGCKAMRKAWLRPCLLLLTGCSIGVHSVSAITCAAMFLMAFLLSPGTRTCPGNLLHTLLCALAFLATAMPLLKLLAGGHAMPTSSQNLALLKEVWQAMGTRNWTTPWPTLGRTLLHYTTGEPILSAGVACFAAAWIFRDRLPAQARTLLSMLPGFILGLAGMLALCLAEMHLAPRLGYSPMSQELFRGTRLLVPLVWLSAVMLASCFWNRLPALFRTAIPAIACIAVFLVSQDKQCLAARHELSSTLHIHALEPARFAERATMAQGYRNALEALKAHSQSSDLVYTDASDLAVRYYAHRPLAATYKDGWLLYYARDMRLAKPWLAEFTIRKTIAGKDITAFHAGLDSANEHTSAPWTPDEATDDAMARTTIHFAAVHRASWLLVRASNAMLRFLPEAGIVFSSKEWIVAKAPMLQQDLTPLPPAPISQDGKALAPEDPKR